MPIRITPVHDFGPCTLNLESIRSICSLINKESTSAKFSARDGVWEIYDEPSPSFLSAISSRKRLDSFVVDAELTGGGNPGHEKDVRIAFDERQASIASKLHPDHEKWLKHVILDTAEFILPPTSLQKIASLARDGNLSLGFSVVSSVVGITFDELSKPSRYPYSAIVLERREPNPLLENLKGNLLSSLIWAALGAILLLISQWLARRYGVDINPFN